MAAALAALIWSELSRPLGVCARLGDARATMEIPNASATSGLLTVFMTNVPSTMLFSQAADCIYRRRTLYDG